MKTNKKISLVTALALAFSAVSATAFADETVLIDSADRLIELAYSTNKADYQKNYRLKNDIDMSQASDERPLKAIGSYSGGDNDIAFCGTFDGAGYTISNLTTTGEALFGYVGEGGVIENLTLEGASVHYQKNDSSKYPAALVSLNRGYINGCFSINSAVVSDYCSPAGGLVGTNFGKITNSGVSGGSVSFTISNAGTSHGGFVGNQRGGSIEQSFSTAVVDAKKWAGGFVGKIEAGTISDCYALGSVKGTEEAGGFAGALMSPGVIKNVYAANDITAQSGGRLAGGKGFSFATAGSVENSYFNSQTTATEAGGSFLNDTEWGKTAAEMKTEDFALMLSENWSIQSDINNGYPYLKNTPPPIIGEASDTVTAKIFIAGYDKEIYNFVMVKEPFEVSVEGNTVTVKDIMEYAQTEGKLSFAYGKNENVGQIVTIEGITPSGFDGWMFAINQTMSPSGVSSALVSDGDSIFWFVGTPENGYNLPNLDDIFSSADEYNVISTARELRNLSENSEKWGENYILSNDIDLSGEEFSPIGNKETPFTGIFDGRGYEISGLTINTDSTHQNIGMFGVLSGAQIKNVRLVGVDITGGSVVGAIAGLSGVDKEKKKGSLIAGCSASGTLRATGNSYIRQTDAGGLVGVNDAFVNEFASYSSAINNCEADVSVTGDTGTNDLSDAGHIGGLVGLNKGTVTNSKALGDVAGGNTTGGFVGSNYGGSIYGSASFGNVKGAYTVGGFAGVIGLYSLAEKCYSTGDVTAAGTNGSNFGGFVGALSGKAKNCVSAGALAPGWSYNGGFAGTFEGTVWSYLDDLRTINNCYANIYTQNGQQIKPLGNYIGGVHAQTDNAAAQIGVDKEAAEAKIASINAKTDDTLLIEASKYKSAAYVPATVKEHSDITALIAKMNENVSANSDVELSYESTESIITADKKGYILEEKPTEDTIKTVTLSFEKDGVALKKDIAVTLFSAANEINADELLRSIAESYLGDASDYWKVIMLAVYDELYGTSYCESIRGDFVPQAVSTIVESKKDTTIAMNIIALRALGYDASNITLKNGEKLNATDKLKDAASTGNNGDAYRLLAYANTEYTDNSEIKNTLDRLLAAHDGNGWSNNYDDGVDPDTTGAVILGLSAYTPNPEVKNAVNNAILYLSSLMESDGNIKSGYAQSNYGTNANTSAICAIGLEAADVDITTDERFVKNSASLYDGVMSFAADDGFVYEYGGATNDLATKQAALAVMAVKKNGSIFDFSQNEKQVINLNKVSDKSGESLSYSHSNKTNSQLPLGNGEAAKTDNKLPYTGYSDVSSGDWFFKAAQYASENELIVGNEKGEFMPNAAMTRGMLVTILGRFASADVSDYTEGEFDDVSADDWYGAYVFWAADNGIVFGTDEKTFAPNDNITREQLAAILYRYALMSGMAKENADTDALTAFSDRDSTSDWAADALSWAVENKLISGMGDDTLAPGKTATRAQFAVIIMNFAELENN